MENSQPESNNLSVVDQSKSAGLDELKSTFSSYADLEDNWDFEGSPTSNPIAISSALTFLDKMPDDLPLPCPEPGREGEVGIYWDNEEVNTFAQVVFEIDGTLTYLAVIKSRDGKEQIFGGEDLSVDEPWPSDLLRVLRLG